MGATKKDGCPGCGMKFRTGSLPTLAEKKQLEKDGVVDLGEPPEHFSCPTCAALLRVVAVRMGTFFTQAK